MIRKLAICLLMLTMSTTNVSAQSQESGTRRLLDISQRLSMLRDRFGKAMSVADEIQLTDSQRVELAALREELSIFNRARARAGDQRSPAAKDTTLEFASAMEERLGAILSAEQNQRIAQLELQQDGAMSLLRPSFASRLNLSAAQQLRIRDAQQDHLRSNGLPQPASYEEFGHACYAILTDQQRLAWSEMVGPSSNVIRQRAAVVPGPITPAKQNQPFRLSSLAPYAHLEKAIAIKELQLTDELATRLAEARSRYEQSIEAIRKSSNLTLEERQGAALEMRQALQAYLDMYENELTDLQKQRLRELQFQSLCERALLEREFRQAAKLSDEQINSLDKLLSIRKEDAQASPEETMRFRQQTLQKGLTYLADSQRQVWDRLSGGPVPLESLWESPKVGKEQ